MIEAYQINEYDLKEIGYNMGGSIAFKVHGYWSSDPIRVYIRRNHVYGSNMVSWGFDISHSSGGRDTSAVQEDSEAVKNFGTALIAASELVTTLKSQVDILEAGYEKMQEEYRKKNAKQIAEQQRKIDQDSELGKQGAAVVVEKAIEMFNQRVVSLQSTRPWAQAEPCVIKAFALGSDDPESLFEISKDSSGKIRVYQRNRYEVTKKRISKEVLGSLLSVSSIRSNVV